MPENIIISQVPETEDVLENKKISPVWQRWFNQLQQFILQYFRIFTISSPQGKIPRIVFIPPGMSQADRDLITSPVNGTIIFNETSGKINYYQQDTWKELA
jgi:hypothetical protein